MADICVQGSEERIQARIAIVGIGQIVLRRGVEVIRQAFDFLDIEDAIGLQEWDLFGDGLALVGFSIALDATGIDCLGGNFDREATSKESPTRLLSSHFIAHALSLLGKVTLP